MRAIDITGRVFGKLTAIRLDGYKGKERAWLCRCECGGQKTLPQCSLTMGVRTSCGKCVPRRVHNKSHGMCETAEYFVWLSMKDRCARKKNKAYKNYGARGIKVCDRWMKFSNFIADMGPRPTPEHTVERRDNSLGYSPDNCEWATRHAQSRNRRGLRWLTLNGETRIATDWAPIVGLPKTTIIQRLFNGWSPEETLTIPYGGKR